MKVAIAHYHLNRGGVTQVIINQLKALDKTIADGCRLQVALLFGGRRESWPENLAKDFSSIDISLHPVSELDYDTNRPQKFPLADQLQNSLGQAGCNAGETVLHLHNHSLGKNTELPGVIWTLAQAGFATLLQIHDFAEDFRPAPYRQLISTMAGDRNGRVPDLLYPQGSHVHYAVLNARDHCLLREAGVSASQLHLLPNAVSDFGPLPAKQAARAKLQKLFGVPGDARFVVYPVRGIRRKNLGEALLWSALADQKTWFGLTLGPLNPIEQKSYQRWKKIAGRLGLKWAFEVGGYQGMEFTETLAAADLILTTSVAEGFGLVFLETWLAGKALVGRDLPAITADFVQSGIRFPRLRPGLLVPVAWFDPDELYGEITSAYQNVVALYERPLLEDDDLREKFAGLIHDGLIDFAVCGPASQQQLIERITGNQIAREQLLEINPAVGEALQAGNVDALLIESNAQIVRSEYSLERIGERLWDVYRQLFASRQARTLQPAAHGQRILEAFLDISRFHPLRVEE